MQIVIVQEFICKFYCNKTVPLFSLFDSDQYALTVQILSKFPMNIPTWLGIIIVQSSFSSDQYSVRYLHCLPSPVYLPYPEL